ncbi:hypothetical protein HK405_014638 [Cladochytrium tenue]|nr:hypothetical protein HK405_014638 [Cladochytrium tenue]
MGYTGPYSLGTRCLTEFLATFVAISLGESLLANEMLPSTKGHAMGYGWVVYGFGLAFGMAFQLFSYASSFANPALCLAMWINGAMDGKDFVALSLAEMAGGFVGACFVYIYFLPHFRTVPETTPDSNEDVLLRTRDNVDPSALRLASYNTKNIELRRRTPFASPRASKDVGFSGEDTVVPPTSSTLARRLAEARYYLLSHDLDDDPDRVLDLLSGGTFQLMGSEVPFPSALLPGDAYDTDDDGADGVRTLRGRPVGSVGGGGIEAGLGAVDKAEAASRGRSRRRHSLQVADMQRRLRRVEREFGDDDAALASVALPKGRFLQATADGDKYNADDDDDDDGDDGHAVTGAGRRDAPRKTAEYREAAAARAAALRISDAGDRQLAGGAEAASATGGGEKQGERLRLLLRAARARRARRAEAVARAAVLADQATKLSIFATRPAIFLPLHNFLVELLGTAFLVVGALLIADRMAATPDASTLEAAAAPFLTAVLIQLLALGLGGPTGFAANPARDLAPRFAHWVLPIAGKGDSEWFYGAVNNVAAMCGGALGGALYMGIHKINQAF